HEGSMKMKNVTKSILRSMGFDVSRLSSLKRNRNQPADDPFLQQKRLSLTEDVKVIFDIGGHRVQTTRTYRKLFPDATIYCLDPFEPKFARIVRTFKNCRLVRPSQMAVGDAVGTKTFYCSNETDMNSLLPHSSRADLLTTSTISGTTQVQTTTIDAF